MSTSAHLTSVMCKECNKLNRVGAIICEKCGKMLLADEPALRNESQTDKTPCTSPCSLKTDATSNPFDGVKAQFNIVELYGCAIAEEARLSVPIPIMKLMEGDPITIGRRARREPDYPPEMDFGFLFYYYDEDESFPISRSSAKLYGTPRGVVFKRVGNRVVHIKRGGEQINYPIPKQERVQINDGDVLIFGEQDNNFRVVVRIPQVIFTKLAKG